MKLSPLQWKGMQILEATTIRQLLFGGAVGPGKTTELCVWQINRRLKYPETVGCIARKKLIDLKLSTLLSFQRIYKKYYEPKYGKLDYNNQLNTIRFPNDSIIMLKHLEWSPSDPDYQDLGSVELSDAAVDEAGECPERGINILNTRIRYKIPPVYVRENGIIVEKKNVSKLLLVSNPTIGWLKDRWVIDPKTQKPVTLPDYKYYLRATLFDNPDKDFVETYLAQLLTLPEYDQKRLIHGDWDYVQNEDPFFTEFRHDAHVGDCEIDNNYPLYLSFDFNMEPTTCLIMQKTDEGINFIREHQVNGGTWRLCQELKMYLHHPNQIFVTGDRSGSSRQTAAAHDYATDYQVIMKELEISKSQLVDTRTANKSHEFSRRLCNIVFMNNMVTINPQCKKLINELKIAKVDINQSLIKDRKVYQMDAVDAFRYGINVCFIKGIPDVDQYKRLIESTKETN